MMFAGSIDRLSHLGKLNKKMRQANKYNDTATQQSLNSGHQALQIQELARDIKAAYGPTLQYMQGMDTYT